MMDSNAHGVLVEELSKTWPLEWPSVNSLEDAAGHPLADEISALLNGRWSSLPYLSSAGVAWVTVAPGAAELRVAIGNLRAWILPSYGWEQSSRSIILPESAKGPLAPILSEVSPSGYFRWWTTKEMLREAIRKLREMRELENLRPAYANWRDPSLYELRQQFRLTLAIGNRETAESVIDEVDKRQLDTAINTRFMRLTMHQHFREYAQIVDDERLPDLLQIRMPQKIKTGVLEAFYSRFIAADDEQGNFEAATRTYDAKIHDRVSGLLRTCRPVDSHAVSRLLQYYRRRVPPIVRDDESVLLDALRIGDWRAVQAVSARLLMGASVVPETLLETARHLVVKSFEHNPDAALQRQLAPTLGQAVVLSVPEDWTGYLGALRAGEWDRCQLFLTIPERPSVRSEDPRQIAQLANTLGELFTDPSLEKLDQGREYVSASLPAIVEDVIADANFPVSSLSVLYSELLTLWSAHYRGSQNQAHTSVLLRLAEGVLAFRPEEESAVFELIRQWWKSRRTRALLPFLAEALELLSENTALSSEGQALWLDGMEVLRQMTPSMSSGERQLWAAVGLRFGIEADVVQSYLPEKELPEGDAGDPLAALGLARIAIVSLHHRAMVTAAELIRRRTGAEVIIDDEKVPSSATEAATNADLILFVWSASKHAVYRAFDGVRDRLVYVQGSGPSSILLSLERWAARRA